MWWFLTQEPGQTAWYRPRNDEFMPRQCRDAFLSQKQPSNEGNPRHIHPNRKTSSAACNGMVFDTRTGSNGLIQTEICQINDIGWWIHEKDGRQAKTKEIQLRNILLHLKNIKNTAHLSLPTITDPITAIWSNNSSFSNECIVLQQPGFWWKWELSSKMRRGAKWKCKIPTAHCTALGRN